MALCGSVPGIHIFAVALGSVEIMLFGGVIFGWHSVVYIYKDTGYFSNLCPVDSTLVSNNNNSPLITNVTMLALVSGSTSSMPHGTKSVGLNNNARTVGQGTFPTPASTSTATATVTTGASSAVKTVVTAKTSSASNGTASADTGYELVGTSTTERDSGGGEELSCKEKMKVNAEGGVSAVCTAQDEQFNLIFSLATGINGMMSFPSGFLYDRLGTRISRIISLVSFLVGQVCLIFASPSNPYLLYPGFIGLVFGGYQILMTNLQLSCLMPALRSTIMSLYSGSYDTSASIFLVFKAAHEAGISINACFTFQAMLYFLIFASSTLLFLPKDRVPFPLKAGYRLRCYLCSRLCGDRRGSLQGKSHAAGCSSEWRIDPNGSIILHRFASTDVLDDDKLDVKTDVNGDTLTEGLTGGSGAGDGGGSGGGSGGGGGDSLSSPAEEKASSVVTGDGEEGEPLSGGHIMRTSATAADSRDEDSAYEMEMEVLPKESIERKREPSPKNKGSVSTEKGHGRKSSEGESMLPSGAEKEKKTFLQVALSPLFLTDVMWISVQRLRSWIFVGMFNPWITRLACGDKALVSHYTSVYAALQFFGILTAPLSGRLMDRKIRGAERYGNPRYERLHAAIASFVLNSTVSVLLTVCTLIPVLKLQYLTFVLHCLHRSFLYGPNSAFVANAFPNEHFGKLFGVTLTTSALFSMLQYPLFLIMQGPLQGDALAINVFLLVLMLVSYVHPLYIWCYLKRKMTKASI